MRPAPCGAIGRAANGRHAFVPVVEQGGDLTSNPFIERTWHSPRVAWTAHSAERVLGPLAARRYDGHPAAIDPGLKQPAVNAPDHESLFFGGEGEIRTHEALANPPVFKTGAINRSATSPSYNSVAYRHCIRPRRLFRRRLARNSASTSSSRTHKMALTSRAVWARIA